MLLHVFQSLVARLAQIAYFGLDKRQVERESIEKREKRWRVHKPMSETTFSGLTV
jgi:hypothetical protein